MQPRRIAMILSNPFDNDPRVEKEALDLAAEGYAVTVVAWDRPGRSPVEEKRGGVAIHRIHVPSTFGRGAAQIPALLGFYRRAWRCCVHGGFDALHCHDLETLALGVGLALRLHIPLVFDAHEPSYYADARRLRPLLRAAAVGLETALLPWAAAVLVTNEYQVRRYRRMRARNVQLVANWPRPTLSKDRAVPRAGRPLTLGRVGALYHDMGVEELLEAHALLRAEFPGLRLLLAGASTPEYEAHLRTLLHDTPDVSLQPGYAYADLPRLYAEIDVAVLPQKRTAWFRHITPTKFFEALAFGVPVLTTDIGGLGNLVRKHRCGDLLETVTAEEIAARVRPFLRDPVWRRAAGRAGREAVERELNWEHSRRTLLETYRLLFDPAIATSRKPQDAPSMLSREVLP
ncbi:MAG: glycosyltransferase family 4 protein [Candidatus Krumholzibacteriia bacterium]